MSREAILRLMAASATYSIAGTVGKIAAFVTVPIVTRALGQAEYGLVDLATGLIALAAIIGGMSAELPAAALVAGQPTRRASIFGTYLAGAACLGTVLGVGVIVASDMVVHVLWRYSGPNTIGVMTGLAIPLTAVQWGTWNVHRVENRPRMYAALSTADLVLKAGAIAVAAVISGSATTVVAVFLASTATGAVVGLWSVRSVARQPDATLVRPLLLGGVPFTVTAVASIAALYAVRSVVAQYGLAEVGDMALGLRLAGLLALPLAAFQLAWGPIGMTAPASTATQSAIERTSLMLLAIGALAAGALTLAAPDAVMIVAGSAFSGAVLSLPGLAISSVLSTCFFMLAVAASTMQSGRTPIVVAAGVGAALQVVVTASLVDLGPQSAVAVGALIGPATAVGLVVATTSALGRGGRIRVVLATIAMVVIGLGLLQLVQTAVPATRWALTASALVAVVLIGAALLRHREASG